MTNSKPSVDQPNIPWHVNRNETDCHNVIPVSTMQSVPILTHLDLMYFARLLFSDDWEGFHHALVIRLGFSETIPRNQCACQIRPCLFLSHHAERVARESIYTLSCSIRVIQTSPFQGHSHLVKGVRAHCIVVVPRDIVFRADRRTDIMWHSKKTLCTLSC
jgi:hypothetical protein